MSSTALAELNDAGLPSLDIGIPTGLIDLSSFNAAMEAAEFFAGSELVPKDYQRKAANIMVAWQKGAEIGLQPMQALAGIAVVNGRASLWGDVGMAVVRRHPEFENLQERCEEVDGQLVAEVTMTRRGQSPLTKQFTQQDAVVAGIWGRNVHKQYPKDMLLWRARWRCARALFPDALQGLYSAEEAQDMPPIKDVGGSSAAPSNDQPAIEQSRSQTALEKAKQNTGVTLEGDPTEDQLLRAASMTKEITKADTRSGVMGIAKTIAECLETQTLAESQASDLKSKVQTRLVGLAAEQCEGFEEQLRAATHPEHIDAIREEIEIASSSDEIKPGQRDDLLGKCSVRADELNPQE